MNQGGIKEGGSWVWLVDDFLQKVVDRTFLGWVSREKKEGRGELLQQFSFLCEKNYNNVYNKMHIIKFERLIHCAKTTSLRCKGRARF